MPYGLRRGSSEERDSHFIIDGSWYAHEVLGDQEASETDDDGFGTTPKPPPFEQNNDSADKIIVTDRSWFAHEALGDRKEEAAPEETEDDGGFGSGSSTFFPKPPSFEKNSDGDKIIVTEGGPGGPGPGWDWDADPDNPYNWPAGKRWAQVAMAASFACLA